MKSKQPGPLNRYGFPFYSSLPPARRPPHPAGNSGAAFAKAHLGPFPSKPKGNSSFALADILGAPGVKEIETAGSLRFHSVGDTGVLGGNSQQAVADAMSADFDVNKPAANPAFFFHLGDVIYGHSKDVGYRDEFYRPYHKYPAKIVSVPGNHDGETFAGTDPKPLGAFLANFCALTAVLAPQAPSRRATSELSIAPGATIRTAMPSSFGATDDDGASVTACSGSRTVKVEPPSGMLSTSMCPPMRSTMRFLSAGASGRPLERSIMQTATTLRSRTMVVSEHVSWRTPVVILVCGCLISLLGFGPRAAFGFFLISLSVRSADLA